MNDLYAINELRLAVGKLEVAQCHVVDACNVCDRVGFPYLPVQEAYLALSRALEAVESQVEFMENNK